MPKKGGTKKGSSKQKSQQSPPAGPASNVKSSTVGISQKHASKIRELVAVCQFSYATAGGVAVCVVAKRVHTFLHPITNDLEPQIQGFFSFSFLLTWAHPYRMAPRGLQRSRAKPLQMSSSKSTVLLWGMDFSRAISRTR